MPNLDENKNSSTIDHTALDNHTLENIELSVSPLMSEGENMKPDIVFQSPTSPEGNNSEVNSNIIVQSPKNINNLTSEIEEGFTKLEFPSIHDTSNESMLGDTVSSFKSCNGSFLIDAHNSFKSLNGSYVIEATSPSKSVKSLLEETLTKIQSPSLQSNANISLHETENNLNQGLSFPSEAPELVKDVSFTQDKVDSPVQNVLDTTVVLPPPNSDDNKQENVDDVEVELNDPNLLSLNQSISFSESNVLNDTPVPEQENKDNLPKVLDDSNLDGALAAFSALKLDDTAGCLSPSIDTTLEEVNDSPNPTGLANKIPEAPISEEINCKVSIQVDSPSAVDNVDKNTDFQTFSLLGEPSGDVIPEAFDGALNDDPFGMQNLDFNPSPDDFVFKVPQNPVETENEEFADAVQFFKDPSSFSFLENIKTSPPMEGNAPRSSLYIKFDPLHSTFPRNPKSSDVLQALKGESGLEPNVQCLNLSARESLGNILISFDSPRKSGGQGSNAPVVVAPAKLYTEEELQQHLNVNELTNQEMLLKKQREMEEDMARKETEMNARAEEKDAKIAKLENLVKVQRALLEELVGVSGTVTDNFKGMLKSAGTLEDENVKLKEDVKTLTEDLQSVETTFADFHKRYEQCKGMLKSYKDNEELLKIKLKAVERENQDLQQSTQEALEKANSQATCVKKTSEAQTAVLKAQLKKAELKISSLESDIKQIKIENSQLGGICDDLMEKVGKS